MIEVKLDEIGFVHLPLHNYFWLEQVLRICLLDLLKSVELLFEAEVRVIRVVSCSSEGALVGRLHLHLGLLIELHVIVGSASR